MRKPDSVTAWWPLRVILLVLMAAAGGGSACGFGTVHGCTDIGCSNQLAVTIRATSASLPAGSYRLDVVADGKMLSCTFPVPAETLPSGALASPACSPGLNLFVGPALKCTTSNDGTVASQHCDPIPDQLEERLAIAGTPSSVTVTQSSGGAVLLQQSATPAYASFQPNGPDCDPTCHQAGVTWDLP